MGLTRRLRSTGLPFHWEMYSASLDGERIPVCAVVLHPPERGSSQAPGAGLTSQHIWSTLGCGLPPLTGEAQEVLVLSAFRKRG